MRRLLFRFLGVLALGAGALYLASQLDRDAGDRPAAPKIVKGPLGDMGDRVPEGGGTVQINPIRDVVITLLEETAQPGQDASVFQPIAEVRGTKAELKTASLQNVYDAVAVYELRIDQDDPDERRRVFDAVSGYRPPPRPPAPDRNTPSAPPRRAEVSYLRLAASEAVLERERDWHHVRFVGGPPDGVQITLFDHQARPVLDMRTDQLTCSYQVQDAANLVLISSDRQVRFFTPDGLYSLQGTGLWSRIRSPHEKDRRVEASFRLRRNVQFVAARGLLPLSERRNETETKRDTDARKRAADDQTDLIHITSRGAAVLALHQDRSADDRATVVDLLELRDAVHIEDHRTTQERDRRTRDRLDLDLFCDALRVWIRDRQLDAAEALGSVHIRAVGQRRITEPARPETNDATGTDGSPRPGEADHTVDLRGDRARLVFRRGSVDHARVMAWSFRSVPTGLTRFGPAHLVLPCHVPPTVQGTLRDADTENGRFRARSVGDLVLDRLGREGNRQRARLTLHRQVSLELEGRRQRPARGSEPPTWIPGSSRIQVRDQLVFELRHEPDRMADLIGTGHVRVETLIGCLEAARIKGTIHDRDHWRLDAEGYPRLDYPLAARTAPALARTLRSLSLTPRVDSGDPGPGKGRVSIEAQRAVIEYRRTGDREHGQARFTEGVKVSQTEELSDPIQLFCHDFVFGYQQDRNTQSPLAADPTLVRAEGNVTLLGGNKTHASGDRLIVRTLKSPGDPLARARRQARIELEGLPARLMATLRDGNQGFLEGRRLVFDGTRRTVRAHTGVRARFFPAPRDLLLPGGPAPRTVRIHAADIECEEAELRWNANNEVEWLHADQAVRMRGYAPNLSSIVAPGADPGTAREGVLIQCASADRLCYERKTGAPDPVRRLCFYGEEDHPVRIWYLDLLHPGQNDFLVVVPVLSMEGPVGKSEIDCVRGFGPGTLFFRSQDNHFGSSARSGTAREKTVQVSYGHGFEIRRLGENECRAVFPRGGEVVSHDPEGKQEGWIAADEELGLLLDIAARKTDEDSRYVERGYARGNVRFQYRGDTRGGCDEAFWERGTNTLTIVGSPAWGQKAGEPRQTFRKAVYNRATRRFQLYHGAGSLRPRFERKSPRENATRPDGALPSR